MKMVSNSLDKKRKTKKFNFQLKAEVTSQKVKRIIEKEVTNIMKREKKVIDNTIKKKMGMGIEKRGIKNHLKEIEVIEVIMKRNMNQKQIEKKDMDCKSLV